MEKNIDSLIEWLDNNIKCREYAKTIVDAKRDLNKAHDTLNENYQVWTPSEWLDYCRKVEYMERGLSMRIKHFFDMVYGKHNSFTDNLKGKDELDHWFTFKDFAHQHYCNCEI